MPDQWTSPVHLVDEDDDYIAPIHGTLLPNGQVMLIGYLQDDVAAVGCGRLGNVTALLDPSAATSSPTELLTFDQDVECTQGYCPGEGACGACENPDCLNDSYFCSGHTLLDNGDLAVFGGLRTFNCSTHSGIPEAFFSGGGGLDYGAIWDWDSTSPAWVCTAQKNPSTPGSKNPSTSSVGKFQGMPTMPLNDGFYFEGAERYYPTATRLPSGRVLVTGGTQVLGMTRAGVGAGVIVDPSNPVLNLTAELFDPTTMLFAPLASPPPATGQALYNADYTHAFVLPKRKQPELYNVVMIGQDGQPVYVRTANSNWSMAGPVRPGTPVGSNPINKGTSTLMLPIRNVNNQWGYSNGSLLVTGGEDIGMSIDVYDEDSSSWTLEYDLATDRHHPSTVLLPDGSIVVLGGHVPGNSNGPIEMRAEYITPKPTGTSWTVEWGNPDGSEVTRGYHMVALLMPDGRVMIAGGRRAGVSSSPNEHASVQFLSPPYMMDPRPTITSYPPTITANGSSFQISVDTDYSEVVLMGLGSMTHSVDMNQRHVQLNRVELQQLDDSLTDPPTAVPGIVPPTSREAPPGWYMMFVLSDDGKRTPSEGVMIQVL